MRPKLEELEEEELWPLIQAGDREARGELVTRYFFLLDKVAYAMVRGLPPHVQAEDLVSYGSLGLMRAVDNFDPSRGTPFRKYAVTSIRSKILDEIRGLDWAPKSLRQKGKMVERARECLRQQGREPSDAAVAAELGEDVEFVRNVDLQVKRSNHASLDEAKLGETESWDYADERANTEESVVVQQVQEVTIDWIDALPEEAQLLLCLSYYDRWSLTDISVILGWPQAKVSSLHAELVLELLSRLEDALLEDLVAAVGT